MNYPPHVVNLAMEFMRGDETAREPFFDALLELYPEHKDEFHKHLLSDERCTGYCARYCDLPANVVEQKYILNVRVCK